MTSSTIFWVFVWIDLGLNSSLRGHWWTLYPPCKWTAFDLWTTNYYCLIVCSVKPFYIQNAELVNVKHPVTNNVTVVFIYIYIYVWMCVYLCVCMFFSLSLSLYIYIYIYIITYTKMVRKRKQLILLEMILAKFKSWLSNTSTAPLQRGNPPTTSVMDMTQSNLMERFQCCWNFGEHGTPLHCHRSYVHSGLKW